MTRDRFTKAAERIVGRMDTCTAHYYPKTMIKDLAAALRRVDRAAEKRGYDKGWFAGIARLKYLEHCAKESIAAENRGKRRRP